MSDALDDLDDTVDDDILEDAKKKNTDPEAVGETIGSGAMGPFAWTGKLMAGVAVGVSRKIPGRGRIQRWMTTTGIEGMWRTSDAHMIAMVVYGDRAVVPRPAQLDREEGLVETNNGEKWSVSEITPCRIGDAPVIWAVADDHELTSPVAARIAEAVDRSSDRVQAVKKTEEGVEPSDWKSPQQAVADGGSAHREPFDDVWVDTRNSDPDADGMVVSMMKAYDLHWSQSSSEEMKKQEDRGRLAEMDPDKYENRGMKMLIVAGIAFALGLFGPALATRVAGGDAAEGAIGLSTQGMMSLMTLMGVA